MQNSFQQAGFIFEPVSGLFYDTKSGLYFSPEHDLYYNGNDANWYRLNPRTNEFIFHSGTEASQAAKKVDNFPEMLSGLSNDFAILGSVGAINWYTFKRFQKSKNREASR